MFVFVFKHNTTHKSHTTLTSSTFGCIVPMIMTDIRMPSDLCIPQPTSLVFESLPESVQNHWGNTFPKSHLAAFDFVRGQTYIATTAPWEDGSKEVLTLDLDEHGERVGFGEIWLRVGESPMVGYTETATGTRQGLGLRRLLVMNYVAEQQAGELLHSGSQISPSAAGVWGKLISLGVAEPYRDELWIDRYRFTQSTSTSTDSAQ